MRNRYGAKPHSTGMLWVQRGDTDPLSMANVYSTGTDKKAPAHVTLSTITFESDGSNSEPNTEAS